MLFDNDSWRETGESVGEGYARMNDELITRLGVLFGAGEIDPDGDIGELVVDSSEIINTLGSNGLSTVGYSSTEIDYKKKNKGLLSSLGFGGTSETEDMDENVQSSNRISSLARKAVMGRLTHPADVSSTERALIVVAGPPEYISRKGVEDARRWIEQETECMEVRGGDYPIKGTDTLAVVVLLSGVTDSRRVKDLQKIAVETQENMEELRENSEDDLDDLLQDEDDELDSLF
jgi:cell division GTPase FtsZ